MLRNLCVPVDCTENREQMTTLPFVTQMTRMIFYENLVQGLRWGDDSLLDAMFLQYKYHIYECLFGRWEVRGRECVDYLNLIVRSFSRFNLSAEPILLEPCCSSVTDSYIFYPRFLQVQFLSLNIYYWIFFSLFCDACVLDYLLLVRSYRQWLSVAIIRWIFLNQCQLIYLVIFWGN